MQNLLSELSKKQPKKVCLKVVIFHWLKIWNFSCVDTLRGPLIIPSRSPRFPENLVVGATAKIFSVLSLPCGNKISRIIFATDNNIFCIIFATDNYIFYIILYYLNPVVIIFSVLSLILIIIFSVISCTYYLNHVLL